MSIDDFLSRLEGVRKEGAGWMACCPAHGDKNPSMSVSIGRNGGILVHCHAGCSAESVVGVMGLKMSDLMPDNRTGSGFAHVSAASVTVAPSKRGGKKLGKKIADYLYKDVDGVVRFKVTRYDPKDFRQYSPDPNDPSKWVFGVVSKGVQYIPYNLPAVHAAAQAHKCIFIVEGEKDVDALASIGITASCNAGGAGKGWKKEYCDYFKGAAKIIVIADNDAGPESGKKEYWQGQRHATIVRNMFRECGFDADVMVLPQRGENKIKDAHDWIVAGGDKAALVEIVKNMPAWPAELEALANGAAESVGADAARDTVDESNSDSNGDGDTVNVKCGSGFGYAVRRPRSPGDFVPYSVDYKLGVKKKLTFTVTGRKHLADDISLCCYQAFKELEGDLPTRVRKDIQAVVTLLWLRARGKFFWNLSQREFSTSMYYDNSTGTLLLIRSDVFQSWLAVQAHVNRSISEFEYIMSLIDDAAMSDECSTGVTPSNLWDRRGDVIYISNGDSTMARISANKIEMVPNCTDNVVFLVKKTLDPWTLLDGDGEDPFTKTKLFEGAAFQSPHGRMLTRLWVMGLFACFRSRPALVFTGRWQSGKSRTAKGIAEMLGTSNRLASVKENGELDFWVSLNSGGLITFDNVDSKNKWFGDAMQAAATDGMTEVRKMYTHEMMQLQASASVILTSNNPLFATESGLSDRLIIVRLEATRKVSSDRGLTVDFQERRNQSMTWIARTLSRALADKTPITDTINMRHPDFGEWAVRIGRAMGKYDEAVSAMASAEIDKSLFPLQNDRVGKQIMDFLCARGGVWSGTSGDLSAQLIERLENPDENDKKRLGTRYIGNCISKYKDQLRSVFKMNEPRILTGKTYYEFAGVSSAAVGVVDYKAVLQESPGKGENAHKDANRGYNPPTPPNDLFARGGNHISPGMCSGGYPNTIPGMSPGISPNAYPLSNLYSNGIREEKEEEESDSDNYDGEELEF